MTELKFDTEGITSCPMNETATKAECRECRYYKASYLYPCSGGGFMATCTYADVFPELKDFAGLEDCIYIKGG